MYRNRKQDGAEYCVVELDCRTLNAETRTIDAVLSTDGVVDMGYKRQRLVHSDAAVGMARAARGLPLLFNHNQDDLIGTVREIRIDAGKLHGEVKFSTSPEGERRMQEAKEGVLKDLSIGYLVDHRQTDLSSEPDVEVVNAWEPFEVSLVTVAADISAGLNRSLQGNDPMDEKEKLKLISETRAQAVKEEQERQVEIRSIFTDAKLNAPDLLQDCITNVDITADEARKLVLKKLGETNHGTVSNGVYIDHGEDHSEKQLRGMELSVLSRAGLPLKEEQQREMQGNEFAHMTLREIARHCANAAGVNTRGMTARQYVGAALTCRSTFGLSTSDFDNVLENSANKFLLSGFDEAQTTWRKITRTLPLSDFKVTSLPTVGAFPNMLEVPAGAEFKYGHVSDRKETIQMLTYGRLFSLTRQAIINDDLGAFTEIPRKMGQAVDRTINTLTYAQLTGNPTLNQDGVALFDAAHANVGTVADITVDSVDATRVRMRKQTDSADANATGLNNDIAMLIVPAELEGRANTLRTATNDPIGFTGALAGATAPNPEQNRWDVVSDVLLSQDSATVWYASANPNATDTLIVGFLDGQSTPFLESENGFTVDGTTWKARIDVAVIPADFRGLQRSVAP